MSRSTEPTVVEYLVGLLMCLVILFVVLGGVCYSLESFGLVKPQSAVTEDTKKPTTTQSDDWGMTQAAVVGIVGQM